MTTAKADVLRKQLLSSGIPTDICSRYIETLRAFLNARLSKSRYEDEMARILPKDKVHVHNGIIQGILFRAQQRREGMRDLPVVTPQREKRPSVKRPPASKALNGTVKAEPAKVKVGAKRPHDDTESELRKPGSSEDAVAPSLTKKPKIRPAIPKKTPDGEKPKLTKPKPPGLEKPSPKPTIRRKGPESTTSLPPPSPSAATAPRMQPPRTPAQAPMVDAATYDGLPYFPVRPGQAMDFELFLKLRTRIRRVALEQLGMASVKDDAVGLMVHAVEHHVKSLMEKAARQRAARDGVRPHRNLQCGPIRGYDVWESARRNTSLLGDESGMELERLSMLL